MKAVVLWTAFIIAGLAEKSALEHGHTRNPLQYLGQDGSIINHFRRNTAGPDRHSRAAKPLGRAAYAALNALKHVLVGTKKLPPRNKCCTDFTKHGDVRQAWKDFDSLQPTDILRFVLPGGVFGKSGEIGDMTIMVRSSGIDKKPVIEFINRHELMKDPQQWSHQEPPIHRITYGVRK